MKKLIVLIILLFAGFSNGQTPKKKPIKAVARKVILKDESNVKKSDLNSDADLVISPTGDAFDSNLLNQDENKIYTAAGVEVKPDFPGGTQKLFSFISKNVEITDEMKENEIKGRVFASFVVEKDGSITDIKIIREIGFGTGREVERALKKMPKWAPAEQNGKKVRCSYQIPVSIYATKQ